MATGDVHTSKGDGRSTRSKEAIALPRELQGGAGSRAGDDKGVEHFIDPTRTPG